MYFPSIALAGLLGFTALSALAQVPIIDGTRPGHVPGVGESLPRSDNASNIAPGSTHSLNAPTLPASSVGIDGSAHDYLAAARTALLAGHTGQAQQSLEMAETRVLSHAVQSYEATSPGNSAFVTNLRDARQAIGSGNNEQAIHLIDQALAI